MTSRFICNLANLFFLVSLLTIFCFEQASSEKKFVKNKTKFERLVKNSNMALKNSVNVVQNRTTRMKRFIDKSFISSGFSSSNASVETLDANAQTLGQHSGYIPIRHSYGARLFYIFFESRRSKSDPIVLWLTGGPGIGSLKAVFYENGPYHIKDDLSLRWNDFGWDKACNLLYVDQPTGTGFSYSSDHRDIRHNSNEVIEDLYDFLQTFFQARPELVENDFYIAGSSYSGHTIPLLVSRLHKESMARNGIHINMKGFAIMNGLTYPEYTFSSLPDFIYANKLVSRSYYDMLKKIIKECLSLIQHCQTDDNVCKDARDKCLRMLIFTGRDMGNRNQYDFRNHLKSRQKIGFPRMSSFLASDQVRMALGVGNRTYVAFSQEVMDAMVNDYMKNYVGVIPQLLEDGIKVLILEGEYDLRCNWLGNLRWTEAMKWSGRSQFLKTKLSSYKVDGIEVGKVKNTGPLTFLKVLNAGHSVAIDQPYVLLQIFINWMNS